MRHNCVVIPRFGGFIASQKAAQIDFSKGFISSPSKSVLFNKQLINNDGLLINSFAIKNNLSFSDAEAEVSKIVEQWFSDLNEGKRVSFENLGFLFLDNEKNICFEQDRFFNLLMDSFGMGQVSFQTESNLEKEEQKIKIDVQKTEIKPEIEEPIIELFPNLIKVSAKKQEEKVEAENKDEKIISLVPESKKSSKKILKYLAAACILPIAFYSVWIPMKTNVLESGMLSVNDFNPFQKVESSSYNKSNLKTKLEFLPQTKSLDEQIKDLPKNISIYSMEIDDEVFFVRLNDGKTKVSENSVEKNQHISEKTSFVEKTNQLANNSGNFQIIVGSFSNQNNAEQLKQDLITKGFNAYTFTQSNGLVRVSAGRTENSAQAQNLVSKLSENSIDSWILK
jgi:hypothetical protein